MAKSARNEPSEVGAPVQLKAVLVVLGTLRALFAIADGTQVVCRHSKFYEEVVGGVRSTVA